MAMTLRLTEQEAEALRKTADREHRSMQEVARSAINEYTSRRLRRRDEAIDRILNEHARVIERLGDA
jgi:predicted transcriptional regulator